MRKHLTTLQLATVIADAVLATKDARRNRRNGGMDDPPTQAVLRAVRERGYWFEAVDFDDDVDDVEGAHDGDAK